METSLKETTLTVINEETNLASNLQLSNLPTFRSVVLLNYCTTTMQKHTGKDGALIKICIDALYTTSWWPRWCTGTIQFFSSGSKLTPFLCKLCEQIFFCFVHQHGTNANHLLGTSRKDFFKNLVQHVHAIPGTL